MQADKNDRPEKIGNLRFKPQAQAQIKDIRKQKTNSERKAKSTEYGLRDVDNPLFDLSVDLYRL